MAVVDAWAVVREAVVGGAVVELVAVGRDSDVPPHAVRSRERMAKG